MVIATGSQAFSLRPNAQGTADGGVQRVLKGSVNFLERALTTELYYIRRICSSRLQNSTSQYELSYYYNIDLCTFSPFSGAVGSESEANGSSTYHDRMNIAPPFSHSRLIYSSSKIGLDFVDTAFSSMYTFALIRNLATLAASDP